MFTVQEYRVALRRGRKIKLAAGHAACAEQAESVFMALLAGLPHEEVWVMGLSGHNVIRGVAKVAQGGMHGAGVTGVEILRAVLLMGCSAFILCHNHPSGDPTPSSADWTMTRAVQKAAEAVGLTLLDHVIVSPEAKRSYCMSGGGL